MIADNVHLRTKEGFQKEISSDTSESIIEAFISAGRNLNAGLFEPMLGEDDVFEDLDKYDFLQSFKETLDRIKSKTGEEDYEVDVSDETCKACSYGKPIKCFHFYRKENGKSILIDAFAYVIDREGSVLKDIYICNALDISYPEEMLRK